LQVIGVGEVIKSILDISFGHERRCKQRHGEKGPVVFS
jgi:hypothetical protein